VTNERLRTLREERLGVSARQASLDAGLSSSVWARAERGERLTLDSWHRIADHLRVDYRSIVPPR
jgi:hypothetical protein